MSTRRSHRIITAVAAACCLTGGVAAAVSSGASAQTPQPDPTSQTRATVVDVPDTDRPAPTSEEAPPDVASMSSPFVPGVPHVPADVLLSIGPGGDARYIGPAGSMFNGPADEVDARVDAWWAKQMAAGVTPEEADRMLANPTR